MLLQNRINYDRKKFYSTGSQSASIRQNSAKSFFGLLLDSFIYFFAKDNFKTKCLHLNMSQFFAAKTQQ